MTSITKKEELINSYNPTFEEASSFNYLQDLVIYLSAKYKIEERKNKFKYTHDFNEMLSATLNSLDYQTTIAEYLEEAKIFMPAFHNKFSLSDIQNRVEQLIQDDNGIDKCYSFLKLKSYNKNRSTVFVFKSNNQIQHPYEKDETKLPIKTQSQCELTFLKEDKIYDLEILDIKSGQKNITNNLIFNFEAAGFIIYKNTDVEVTINRDVFYKTIVSIELSSRKNNWILQFDE